MAFGFGVMKYSRPGICRQIWGDAIMGSPCRNGRQGASLPTPVERCYHHVARIFPAESLGGMAGFHKRRPPLGGCRGNRIGSGQTSDLAKRG